MTKNLINSLNLNLYNIEWDRLTEIIISYSELISFKDTYLHLDFSKQIYREKIYSDTKKLINIFEFDFSHLQLNLSRIHRDDLLEKYLIHLCKEGCLNYEELNQVIKSIEVYLKLSAYEKLGEFLENKPSNLNFFKPIIKYFRSFCDEDGYLNLNGISEIKAINEKIKDLEDSIRDKISKILKDPKWSKSLQFESFDIIDNHYVIPVRSDSYQSELGNIISRSETGHTLFIEPYQIKDLTLKRLHLNNEKQIIINKLMDEISLKLFPYTSQLLSILSDLKYLNLIMVRAQFAVIHNLTSPIIRKEIGFSIKGLFHPLVEKCVRNDVELNSNHLGIIISGPNTGGKTVFLKSVVLSYLLFQHGYFVPAKFAELYPYTGLFFCNLDQQNIDQGLSSFSGEVTYLIETLSELQSENLILIDEIFHSTASDEASALALGLFSYIHSTSKSQLIVSTHHQLLKVKLHQIKSYISAHVGFDLALMRPTYKIFWGEPGSSLAIEVFNIITHSQYKNISENALTILEKKHLTYEQLLSEVSQKKIELNALIIENDRTLKELRNQKDANDGILKLKTQETVSEFSRKIESIFNNLQQEVDQLKKSDRLSSNAIHNLKIKQIKTMESYLPNEVINSELHDPKKFIPINIDKIKVGDFIFSHEFKKTFQIQEINQEKRLIQATRNHFRVNLSFDKVSPASNANNTPQFSFHYKQAATVQHEYDLRGYRLDAFENMVQRGINDLLQGEIPFLNIIHGHGDGILKKWLRNFIKSNPQIQQDINQTGNDGETRIILSN